MFIDVTRYGGMRILRVATAAIAYLDAVEGGSAIHLIGGETLRVNEDPQEIELRCMIAGEGGDAPAPTAEKIVTPSPPSRRRRANANVEVAQ